MEDTVIQNLIKESHKIRGNAYSPYSNVCVGASLLCEDGTVISGCNVENSSYGLSLCAERTAIVAAVARGHRKFKAIAVTSNIVDLSITPCGACRQFMAEFGMDCDVYMVKPDSTYFKMKVKDLLPHAFGSDAVKMERVDNHS